MPKEKPKSFEEFSKKKIPKDAVYEILSKKALGKKLELKSFNIDSSKVENEILNKKKIFPISYLFDEYKDSLEHQKKLGTIYMKRMIEFEDMKYLNELFYSSESSNAYEIKIEKLSQEIINNLNKIDNQSSDLKNHLHEIQLLWIILKTFLLKIYTL